jgi:putative hemolysin
MTDNRQYAADQNSEDRHNFAATGMIMATTVLPPAFPDCLNPAAKSRISGRNDRLIRVQAGTSVGMAAPAFSRCLQMIGRGILLG